MEEPLFFKNVILFINQHIEFSPETEVCGLLAGPKFGEITAAIPICNIERSDICYRIAETDMLRGQEIIKEQGLVWNGIYHSHVHDDAMPSNDDMDNMPWKFYYVIVSPKHKISNSVYYRIGEHNELICRTNLRIV